MKKFFQSVSLLVSCAFIAITPQTPQGTLTGWDGSFHWAGVEGATWYKLEVWQGQTRVYSQWHELSCVDCAVSVETLLPGEYWWDVLDWGTYGYGTWSAPVTFSFETLQTAPPPTEWTISTDGSFAEAMQAMTDCGTVYIDTDLAEPAISYGESRTASYILPDYGCDWEIVGSASVPVVTYDPSAPPSYYNAPGVLMLIENSHKTIVRNLHFFGTMALGDGVNIDRDICLLLDAPGNMDVIDNVFSDCGHAGLKHFYGTGTFLISGNRCFDNGFTSRDHCMYLPGGGQYTITDNFAINTSGWCVGFGNVYQTSGAVIENNTCINNGGGVCVGYGGQASVSNNVAIGNDRGLWLEDSGSTLTNNVFMDSVIEDVYSERAEGGNLFYDRGNIYESISHPDRIQ